MILNRYNFIAPVYDTIKGLVFGKALRQACFRHEEAYKSARNVLVVGGGSGQELPLFSPRANVTFVETSSTMISLAKKRTFACSVDFVHANIFEYQFTEQYDLILFNFILDLFPQDQVVDLLNHIKPHLDDNGKIVACDFYPIQEQAHVWKKLLLKTTIVFFSITTSLRIKEITNIQKCLELSGYQLVKLSHYFSGMVFATLWVKDTY